MNQPVLELRKLSVEIEGKPILKSLSLSIPLGQVHALMGRNGSGKSSLGYTLLGHPKYKVTSGDIFIEGQSILALPTDERARRGLFLAFQYPTNIPGVTVSSFLREACRSVHGDEYTKQFRKLVTGYLDKLGISKDFMNRFVHEGFSGGEKKRLEVLQMLLLQPKICILDETDSGLDVDALKIVATAIQELKSLKRSFLVITHYQRMLEFLKPDRVHVLSEGLIARSGDSKLAEELDSGGYESILSPSGA